ncbi:MAG: flagellar filament capping protein FliD [Pseudomonas sp.]|uniref:flagellar filament capping protein FliD n=1 Tax=Pseudomonas sp. TaxID=306 RepID=UPI003393507C
MVSITGVGSGLDIDKIVGALVNAERAPKQGQLDRLEKATTSRISALGSLRSVVGNFASTLTSLSKASAFQKQTVSSTNSSVFTVSSSKELAPSRFALKVEQLASSSKVALQSVSGTAAATFNSGSLTISAGSNSIDVAVSSPKNTLADIRDAINKEGSSKGISASIVSDASGSRLVLSSSKTGEGNDLKVTATQDGVSKGSNALTSLAFAAGSAKVQLPSVAGGAAATFKEGTLKLSSGAVNLDVAVGADASLADVRDAINSAGSGQGFSATLESVDGGAARLVVHSSNGDKVDVTSTSADTGDGSNNLSTLNSVADSNARTNNVAKSAKFSVDGLSVVKDSNSISDVIDGLTINLVGAQSADDLAANKTVDIVVGQDKGNVRGNIQKFVDTYNQLMKTANELTAVVPVGEGKAPVTGPLLGDTSVRNLLTGLRKEMVKLGDTQTLGSLAEIGISTQKDGTLSIDNVKLDDALTNQYDKLTAFMSGPEGLMGRLEKVVKPYADGEGILGQRQKSLQTTLNGVDKQKSALNLRIEKVQTRLYAQYNAMDSLVGRLKSTSDSLANQLASLPGFVRKD